MGTETRSEELQHAALDPRTIDWRYEQLVDAGFAIELADELATDWRFDLHVLIDLVERGCTPTLAVRILAPLDCQQSRDTSSPSPGSDPRSMADRAA